MGQEGHYEEDMSVSGDEAVQGVDWQQGPRRRAGAVAMDRSRCPWLSWEPTALGWWCAGIFFVFPWPLWSRDPGQKSRPESHPINSPVPRSSVPTRIQLPLKYVLPLDLLPIFPESTFLSFLEMQPPSSGLQSPSASSRKPSLTHGS